MYPNWDVWFENKPSGNPGLGRPLCSTMHKTSGHLKNFFSGEKFRGEKKRQKLPPSFAEQNLPRANQGKR
jgi:hypothetical protein